MSRGHPVQHLDHSLVLVVTAASHLPMLTIKSCSVVLLSSAKRGGFLSQPRLTDVLRFVVPLPRSTNAAAYATSDECHQLTTVRRHSVYNTWRSHRWQHTVKRDISRNRYFSTLPLVGRSWNIAVNFLMEELEWRSYRRWEIFWGHLYSFRQNTWTWRAEGRTDTASPPGRHIAALMHSIVQQLERCVGVWICCCVPLNIGFFFPDTMCERAEIRSTTLRDYDSNNTWKFESFSC